MYPSPDDEIVDAEIVEDEPGMDLAVIEAAEVDVRRLPPALAAERGSDVALWLTRQQRLLLREALTHYHDKGPRQRSTKNILDLITYMADNKPDLRCQSCGNTGRVRTMYEMTYCNCRHGVQAREDGRGTPGY